MITKTQPADRMLRKPRSVAKGEPTKGRAKAIRPCGEIFAKKRITIHGDVGMPKHTRNRTQDQLHQVGNRQVGKSSSKAKSLGLATPKKKDGGGLKSHT